MNQNHQAAKSGVMSYVLDEVIPANEHEFGFHRFQLSAQEVHNRKKKDSRSILTLKS